MDQPSRDWRHIFSVAFREDISFCNTITCIYEGKLAYLGAFSSEFKAGRKIAVATDAERKLAWVPTTNDANEGSLGSIALWCGNIPISTYCSTTRPLWTNITTRKHSLLKDTLPRVCDGGSETMWHVRPWEVEKRETDNRWWKENRWKGKASKTTKGRSTRELLT